MLIVPFLPNELFAPALPILSVLRYVYCPEVPFVIVIAPLKLLLLFPRTTVPELLVPMTTLFTPPFSLITPLRVKVLVAYPPKVSVLAPAAVLLIFPFNVKLAFVAPLAKIDTPLVLEARLITLSDTSFVDPVQRNVPFAVF